MLDSCCGGKPQPQPTFMSKLLEKVFVSEIEKNRRLEICKNCEHFNKTYVQCKLCGCFLEAKTRLQGFHCALPKVGKEAAW